MARMTIGLPRHGSFEKSTRVIDGKWTWLSPFEPWFKVDQTRYSVINGRILLVVTVHPHALMCMDMLLRTDGTNTRMSSLPCAATTWFEFGHGQVGIRTRGRMPHVAAPQTYPGRVGCMLAHDRIRDKTRWMRMV